MITSVLCCRRLFISCILKSGWPMNGAGRLFSNQSISDSINICVTKRNYLQLRSMMMMMMMMMMIKVLWPKAGSLVFTPPRDEMSEGVSRCLPHRQLWVSNLSKVATKWLEVDSNLRPSDSKKQNIPPYRCVPLDKSMQFIYWSQHIRSQQRRCWALYQRVASL